jgi:hypothetical protein
MSRFCRKYYTRLLESPKTERYRNAEPLYREKTLWRLKGLRKYLAYDMFKVQLAVIFSGLTLALLLIALSAFSDNKSSYLILASIFGAAPLLIMAGWCVGNTIWIKARCGRIVRNREDVEFENSVSSPLQKYNTYHVRAIRQTLGSIYCVNPKKIYLSDTPKSLRSLGCAIEPYAFELILGVAKRLGIRLNEAEVDRLGDRIRNNAHNVEQLTAILCEELSAAEEAQTIKGVEIQDTKENIKTNEYSSGLLLGCLVALVFGVTKLEGVLKNDETVFNLSVIISIMVPMVVSFFVVFLLCTGLAKLSLYSDRKKSEKPSIYGDINLEELKELADNSPMYCYVNRLIWELYHKQDYEKTLKKYEPLPLIEDFDLDEMPWFAEVANRLKKMAKLEEVPFIKPRSGTIPLVIDDRHINLNVEFCDGLRDGYVQLKLEKKEIPN